MDVVILRIGPELPQAFYALSAEADAEGFSFLGRLRTRWRNGAYDSDADASVLAAEADGDFAAIGAQTYDEYDPSPAHRRLRQFYVAPRWRRRKVGSALAAVLAADAFRLAPRLHLRATHPLSTAFWDARGFTRVARPDRTHEKVRA